MTTLTLSARMAHADSADAAFWERLDPAGLLNKLINL